MTGESFQPQRGPFIAIDRVFADVAGLALVAMMLLTVASSAGRFGYSMPIPDVEAIAEMLLVAVAFLPLAYTQALREHVEVTLFTDHLSSRAIGWFVWFGCLVGLIGFAFLGYAMGLGAHRAYVTGDAYLGVNQIVTWPARMIAVVGIVALIIRLVLDLTVARRRAYTAAGSSADHLEGY